MKSWIARICLVLIILGAASGAAAWYIGRRNGNSVHYRTTPLERGDLVATIDATGTVEPEEVVDVGAQVAGQILSFGKDDSGKAIDYRSQVEDGTVLARIDDSLYAADVATSKAALDQANATVVRAQADLQQMIAKLHQAQNDWDRAQKLGPSDALSQSDFDSYQAAFETAKANVAVDRAAIEQDKAAVVQAQATLDRAKTSLSYCTIVSPVKGVIIDRRVNIGETVVSSLNTPSLFLIAKDLRRMQVWVAVNEADIGSIHAGQPVTFTCDTFANQTFTGTVNKIRLNAAMTQNVVTYTVEVTTDNSTGQLMPYMTANAHFEVNRRPDVLQVPNIALRWMPASAVQSSGHAAADGQAAGDNESAEESAEQAPATRPASEGVASAGLARQGRPHGGHHAGTIYVLDGTAAKPIKVRVGATDGQSTEISSSDLQEGMAVIVGEQRANADDDTVNPFVPQFRRH